MIRENSNIMALFGSNEAIHYHAYQALRGKWPQLNEQTRVCLVPHWEVHIQRTAQESRVDMMTTKRINISGWARLKFRAFGSLYRLNLDDPKQRWEYQTGLWRAIANAPKFILWRVLGRLTGNRAWYERGTELIQEPPRAISYQTDTIRMERFGFRMYYNERLYHTNVDEVDIICGYYAPTDTLYVYRRDTP